MRPLSATLVGVLVLGAVVGTTLGTAQTDWQRRQDEFVRQNESMGMKGVIQGRVLVDGQA